MPIDRMRPEPLRSPYPRPIRGTQGAEGEGVAPVRGAEAINRADRIEISNEGHQLAARLEVDRSDTAGRCESLTPDRVAEIRGRIESGMYDTPAVAKAIAEKLIALGEV